MLFLLVGSTSVSNTDVGATQLQFSRPLMVPFQKCTTKYYILYSPVAKSDMSDKLRTMINNAVALYLHFPRTLESHFLSFPWYFKYYFTIPFVRNCSSD